MLALRKSTRDCLAAGLEKQQCPLAHALDPRLRQRRRLEKAARPLDGGERRRDRVRHREAWREGGHGYSSPRKARCWRETKRELRSVRVASHVAFSFSTAAIRR